MLDLASLPLFWKWSPSPTSSSPTPTQVQSPKLIHIFGGVYLLTETVGAALWAADIESQSTSMTDETAPGLRELANDADKKEL